MASAFPVLSQALRRLRLMDKPQYDGITSWNLIPLRLEIDSVSQLLRKLHHSLAFDRPVDDHYEVYLTLMSAAMERTLRVTLGFAYLKRQRGWSPHLDNTRHRISEMSRSVLKSAAKHSRDPGVLSAVEAIRSDTTIQAMIELLQYYAQGGRFHYLDELARKKSFTPGEGSLGAWWILLMVVESSVLAPELDDELDETHKFIAGALRQWLAALSTIARSGALGRRAIEFGERIDPASLFKIDLRSL